MAVLRDERLILRPVNRRDRRFYARLYGDASLMAHIGPPLVRAAAMRSAEVVIAPPSRCTDEPSAYWIVEPRPGRERAGLVGWRRQGVTLELGVILAAPWQGHGLAERALRLLRVAALIRSDVARLVLRHHPGHTAMASVARKLGFLPQTGFHDPDAWQVWALTKPPLTSGVASHDEVS